MHCVSAAFACDLCWTVCICLVVLLANQMNRRSQRWLNIPVHYSNIKNKNKKRKRKLPKQGVRLDKHVANYHMWVTCGILFPFVTTRVSLATWRPDALLLVAGKFTFSSQILTYFVRKSHSLGEKSPKTI